jgi:hypothetical protein
MRAAHALLEDVRCDAVLLAMERLDGPDIPHRETRGRGTAPECSQLQRAGGRRASSRHGGGRAPTTEHGVSNHDGALKHGAWHDCASSFPTEHGDSLAVQPPAATTSRVGSNVHPLRRCGWGGKRDRSGALVLAAGHNRRGCAHTLCKAICGADPARVHVGAGGGGGARGGARARAAARRGGAVSRVCARARDYFGLSPLCVLVRVPRCSSAL